MIHHIHHIQNDVDAMPYQLHSQKVHYFTTKEQKTLVISDN